MVKEVRLPDLGEGIEGADVSEVVVSVGDTVSKDDTLLVLESDKASMEIPAEEEGVIREILVSSGDSLETGALLMKLETTTSMKTVTPYPYLIFLATQPKSRATPTVL